MDPNAVGCDRSTLNRQDYAKPQSKYDKYTKINENRPPQHE